MILSAQKISKKFHRIRQDSNQFTAVYETSLSLEPGRFYVVSGHSGSGKSTLLNMLSGILAPSSGKVLLDGTEIYSLNDDKRSMLRSHCFGFLPQGQNALYSLTVLENVLAPYTLHGAKAWQEVSCEDAGAYAMFLLEQANIAQLADIMPAELSGGEIRRMAIARALIRKPAILFADEPTGDLDPENTRTVLTLFRTLADRGMTVFLVSHDTEALEYADHICRMKDGILTGGSHD